MTRPITLARWNDQHGITAGWWLIREIPGLCVHRSHPDLGWCIAPVRLVTATQDKKDLDLSNFIKESKRVWGRFVPHEEAEAFIEEHGVRTAGFKTREAAVQELERAVVIDHPRVLAEALDKPA